jgi:hypothetical protein
MIYLTFLSAFLLSGIAAYYSIIGLASIFPGSFLPVVIMGSALEFSKLVTASWLYRNWSEANKFLRVYLTVAVVTLMLITSMGIFGFLSKAHMEHSADMGPVADRVAIYDEKIKTERENIETNRKQLKQMDDAVDQVMGRSEDEKGADKAVAIRRSQQKERSRLLAEISTSQEKVRVFSDERSPIANELRKAESDVGPIKYIAALIYTDVGNDVLDKAVRLVILLIILVFDPLAVLLLIAGNMSMQPKPRYEPDDGPLTEEQIIDIKESVEEEYKIPVFVAQKDDTKIQVERNNLIMLDEVTGETMPTLTSTQTKKLEPKYDYNEPFSFKEKDKK